MHSTTVCAHTLADPVKISTVQKFPDSVEFPDPVEYLQVRRLKRVHGRIGAPKCMHVSRVEIRELGWEPPYRSLRNVYTRYRVSGFPKPGYIY